MYYFLTITLIISALLHKKISHSSSRLSSFGTDGAWLNQCHFTMQQADALLALREKYYYRQEARRLCFARYLVEHGHLSEDC